MSRRYDSRIEVLKHLGQLIRNSFDDWLHHVERIHVERVLFSMSENWLNKLQIGGVFDKSPIWLWYRAILVIKAYSPFLFVF